MNEVTSLKQPKKIIVAMSGGVDSSVAALLLKKQGYDVAGLFMKNWEADDDDAYCTSQTDLADAQAVCASLQISLHTVNFSKAYWQRVFDVFLKEYQANRTPNPDILCNKEIKFNAFLEHAKTLGAEAIATGHYVQKQWKDDHFELFKAQDKNKDQSYFLYTLTQSQIAKSLFPIGHLQKSEVREIAEKAGLVNARKKDSTGICFIGERKFRDFLQQYLLPKPGKIISMEGNTLGTHQGLMFYTLGQRQGLGIGGQQTSEEAPWYVVDKDAEHNYLIVAQGHDHPALFAPALVCDQVHWIVAKPVAFPFHCQAKIRYRQETQACIVESIDALDYRVIFEQPQRAITPGQSVVFYQDQICLGGGIIDSKQTDLYS